MRITQDEDFPVKCRLKGNISAFVVDSVCKYLWFCTQLGDRGCFRGNLDRTGRAFEFERAVWNSLGEWKYFILKANNDDVTRGFLINIHDVGKAPPTNTAFWLDRHWWCYHFMRYTLVMSSLYAFWSWSVYTNFPAVLGQKQGSPSTVLVNLTFIDTLLRIGRAQ